MGGIAKTTYKLLLKFQWGIRSEYKNEDDSIPENVKKETNVDDSMSINTRVKRNSSFA